jgi:DNA-binding PadR family transcriptional regulator
MAPTDSPLPTAALHILLAIGPEVRHGYAIMSEVAASTAGAVRLAPGTLYTNIKRLLAAGLIEGAEGPAADHEDDARRRYYRLTLAGHRIIADEVARMERLVTRARDWVRDPSG